MLWLILLLAALALVALVVVVLPRMAEARRSLPDQRRAPGEILDLPQGRTHAQWHGKARGPVIVAIHGLTTPSPVWDGLIEELLDLGYRVLVYDLYGRGYSDNAAGRQDAAFFVQQLDALLDHYGLSEDVTLLGYSLGGAIAAAYAAARPERVKRLALICPAGMGVNRTADQDFVAKYPVIGDFWFGLVSGPRMFGAITEGDPALAAIQAGELGRRGYLPAVLSSIRNLRHRLLEEEHRLIGRAGIPVLAIWGGQDQTVPIRGMGRLALWNRTARQEVVEEAGHSLPHSQPAAVGALLRDILREDWED